MIEANKIVYYEKESGSEYCILYASIARIGVVRISPGIYSDELPFGWQTIVQEALELTDFSCDDVIAICDGDILQLHTDYISNHLFDLICKTTVNAIINNLTTSYLVVKSAAVSKEDDIAKIYFKATETQKANIYADIEDLHIVGVDVSQCNETIIAVNKKDLPPELDYNVLIEQVCSTIAEYVPIG